MESKPLVSVLMTAYNREKYIAEAIESVLASTYTNFELLIVDDCSADKTVEIARSYEVKDSRIKVYVNENNLGQFQNRDRAASLAKGKYLKYLDSDDIIYTHGLEVMVNAMERFPEAGVGFEDQFKQDVSGPFPILVQSNDAYKKHFLGGGFFFVGPSAQIILKKAFDEIGGWGENPYVASDIEFLIRIASKYPVVKFQPGTIWWRQHSSQEFKRYKYEYWVSLERHYNFLISILLSEHCPLTGQDKLKAVYLQKKLQVRRLIRLALFKGDFRNSCSIFRNSNLTVGDIFSSFIPNRLIYKK
jgi:glycosyltransferase involved in cell wall biosynthesis